MPNSGKRPKIDSTPSKGQVSIQKFLSPMKSNVSDDPDQIRPKYKSTARGLSKKLNRLQFEQIASSSSAEEQKTPGTPPPKPYDSSDDVTKDHAYVARQRKKTTQKTRRHLQRSLAVISTAMIESGNAPAEAMHKEEGVIKDMSSHLANTFSAMVKEKLFDQAIEFLEMMPTFRPPSDILHDILFKVLLLSEDPDLTLKTSHYCLQLLRIYPPTSDEIILYYKTAIFCDKSKKNQAVYEVLADLVRCCLKKCCVRSDLVSSVPCNKNCMEVFQFVVTVMSKNHEAYIRNSSNGAGELRSHLLSTIFWPFSEADSFSNQLSAFTCQMDATFSSEISGRKVELVNFFMSMLNNATDYVLHFVDMNEMELLEKPLPEAIVYILQYIRDAATIRTGITNFQIFLLLIKQNWLRIFVCLNTLNCILYSDWWRVGNPLSLRKIVKSFLTFGLDENDEDDQSEPDTRTCYVIKKEVVGTTSLHQACRSNRPGTLLRLLTHSDLCVNAIDEKLNTALHYACQEKSYICARILLLKSPQEADVFVKDAFGNTPLHISCSKNDMDISRLLLEAGGKRLYKVKNKDNMTASEMTEDAQMRLLLESIKKKKTTIKTVVRDCDDSDDEECHSLSSVCKSTDCAMYIQCLFWVISYYIDFYKLINLKQSNCLTDSAIREYLQRNFNYTAKLDVIETLRDDVHIMNNLSTYVQQFVELLKNTRESIADVEDVLDILTFLAANV